jgi:TRAP-type C4-dicarboxylate transport system permease small subunit
MQTLAKFLDTHMIWVRRLIKTAIILLFAVQVLVVFSQVVWRFVFNDPFSWSEELARYLQVWLILLASSVCIRKGRHLAVDFATHVLPFRINKILKQIIMVCIMGFTWILIVFSVQMILITIHQITPAMRVPILVVYSAFPVAGICMFMESLIVFLKLVGVKGKADMDAIYGG